MFLSPTIDPNYCPRNIYTLRSYAAFISIAISFWLIFNNITLNRDGMLYDETANIFLQHGLEAARANYNWPFLSVLAAVISQVFYIDTSTALQVITTASFLLITDFFIRINFLTTNNIKIATISALLILSLPAINGYRGMVIRDPGAWASMLAAIYYACLYWQQKTRPTLLLSSLLLIFVACFFRAEFIIFSLAFPAAFLFSRRDNSSRKSAIIAAVGALLLAILLLLIFRFPEYKIAKQLSTTFNLSHLLADIHRNSDIIANKILNEFSAEYATSFYLFGLLGSFITIVVFALQPAFTLIAAIRFKLYLKTFLQSKALLVLTGLMLIPLFMQFVSTQILVARYTGFLAILLLFPLVHVVDHIYSERSKLKYFVGVIIAIAFLDNVISTKPNDKSYLVKSGEWVKTNHPGMSIGSNDKQTIYLATGVYNKSRPTSLERSKKDFYILIAREAPANKKHWRLVEIIDTKAKKSAYIYQRKQ
ncbi:hypothetical protein SIN8267_02972 [Sinobacterium norvegicum]|uniref:Glycosyltransferase RgtA/B/C/D-like domain-containing protein n=1 Tax=Sinobacterium norvegicum TaxID=1641715 RepID=A0ABN8ENP6_9GAMM|nr:hypothetical protein [Sinobacterium norvegicum]CAH0992835.1 hypothetical protein SIN8267_02972 [Sinobacterium norvegicum]